MLRFFKQRPLALALYKDYSQEIWPTERALVVKGPGGDGSASVSTGAGMGAKRRKADVAAEKNYVRENAVFLEPGVEALWKVVEKLVATKRAEMADLLGE